MRITPRGQLTTLVEFTGPDETTFWPFLKPANALVNGVNVLKA